MNISVFLMTKFIFIAEATKVNEQPALLYSFCRYHVIENGLPCYPLGDCSTRSSQIIS